MQAGGRRFDPDQLHHIRDQKSEDRGQNLCAEFWLLVIEVSRLFFNKLEEVDIDRIRVGVGADRARATLRGLATARAREPIGMG